jgi:DNA-binding HxlR family transcriptional regulator
MQTQHRVKVRNLGDVLDLLQGRWKAAVVICLSDRPKRFNILKHEMGRITPRILIKELRHLEVNKIIEKVPDKRNSHFMEYQLTDHGKYLYSLIENIAAWGTDHRMYVMSNETVDHDVTHNFSEAVTLSSLHESAVMYAT